MSDVNRHVGELEQAFVDAQKAKEESSGVIPAEYGGVVALGRAYAQNIDESRTTDTETATKALYLGPHLLGVMKLLGMAPTEADGGSGKKSTASPKVQKDRATVIDLLKHFNAETAAEAAEDGA